MIRVQYDYGHGGCEHHDMGHCCIALIGDGQVVWMVGGNDERDVCEDYEPEEG